MKCVTLRAPFSYLLNPMAAQDKKRAKLIDVARLAGVSPGTVSNALHNTRFVEPETRRRIEEAIAALGYTPNIRARQLRTGKTNTIALLSSLPLPIASGASKLGFMMEVALTAAITALQRQHALILVPPGANPLNAVSFDAAIVIEPAENDAQLGALEQAGIPYVTIGRTPGTAAPAPWVDLHSAATAALLLDHLKAAGSQRRALFVSSTPRTSTLDTVARYREQCGNTLPPVVYFLEESEGEAAGYAAAQRLLVEHPEVDGLLVLVDTFASGAVRAFRDAGVAIPDRIKIATRYDGIRARESAPPLSAVNLHLDDVASAAIELLFDLMEGKTQASRSAPLPTLIARASTLG